MANSSFIYSVDEESAEVATPYLVYESEPRALDWQSWVNLGDDMGLAG